MHGPPYGGEQERESDSDELTEALSSEA